MSNTNQNMKQAPNSKENSEKMHKKIKETWSGMSDNDIKLYDGKRDEFVAKVAEKTKLSKEDAQKKIQQLEKECGCGSAKAA